LTVNAAPPTRVISLSGNLAFGNIPVGTSATRTLTIANTRSGPLTVGSITYPVSFSGNWSGGTVAAGVDAAPIRRLFGQTRLLDPHVRVTEAVTEKAWRLAATLTSDDAFGIHLAESLPRGALDLVEYALRSSSSLAKGLDRLARYGHLLSDRGRNTTTGANVVWYLNGTALVSQASLPSVLDTNWAARVGG